MAVAQACLASARGTQQGWGCRGARLYHPNEDLPRYLRRGTDAGNAGCAVRGPVRPGPGRRQSSPIEPAHALARHPAGCRAAAVRAADDPAAVLTAWFDRLPVGAYG